MNVLVTDDSYKSSLGIVRSLGRKGVRVSVMSTSSVALASRSRYCSQRHVLPPLSDGSFLPALENLLRRVPFDLVMPVGYTSTVTLARHRARLDPLARLEIAPYHRIRAAADKIYTHKLAQSLDVPTPQTFFPERLEDVVALSPYLRMPVVIKAPCETPGTEVHYVQSREGLLPCYHTASAFALAEGRPLPIIQEFIPGDGCGFFALYQNGVCKRIFMHKRIRETPPSGGASCCAISFYDPTLKAYGMRLLDWLTWHGVAMVEFRLDRRDGRYKLMEINPKFWGSLDLALTAGVDFPGCLCQMAKGEELEYSESYRRNLRFHWPLQEIQHALSRPSSFCGVAADFIKPSVKSNVLLSDPKPILLEPVNRLGMRVRQMFATKESHCAHPPIQRKSSL